MRRSTQWRPVASRLPWTGVVAVLFVVPGTLLSFAIGAVGAAMLLALAVDYLTAGDLPGPAAPPVPVATQVAVAAGAAAALGAAIALGAWIV